MLITKVFNNSAVAALDADGCEVILLGAGVGFTRRRGEEVDDGLVERVFRLTSRGGDVLERAVASLPDEVLALTAHVTQRLAESDGVRLRAASEVALADHLWRALTVLEAGVGTRSEPWEGATRHPRELRLARQVLQIVEEVTGRRLPAEEAGWIALHLASAE